GKCPEAPSILTQPVKQTVQLGSGNPAIFTVSARGSMPVTYQWFKGTTQVGTSRQLTIATPQNSDAGNYHVVVSNPHGNATSIDARLIVNPSEPSLIPAGAVAWWRAEGDNVDAINGHTGDPVGNVLYASGHTGQAFQLDGDSYVDVPSAEDLKFTGPFTIEGWIRFTGTGNQTIVAKGVDNDEPVDWALAVG